MGAGRVNAEGQIHDLLFSMEGLNTCSWERVLSWESSRGYKGAVVRNYRREPSTPRIQGREFTCRTVWPRGRRSKWNLVVLA